MAKRLLIFSAFLLLSVFARAQRTLYISESTGNDDLSNDCSYSSPCQTIGRAIYPALGSSVDIVALPGRYQWSKQKLLGPLLRFNLRGANSIWSHESNRTIFTGTLLVPNGTFMSANISSIIWKLEDTPETLTNEDWSCSVFLLANAMEGSSIIDSISISYSQMSVSPSLSSFECFQVSGSINQKLSLSHVSLAESIGTIMIVPRFDNPNQRGFLNPRLDSTATIELFNVTKVSPWERSWNEQQAHLFIYAHVSERIYLQQSAFGNTSITFFRLNSTDDPMPPCDHQFGLAKIIINNTSLYGACSFKFTHLQLENSTTFSWMRLKPAAPNCTSTSAKFYNNYHYNVSIHTEASGLVLRKNRFLTPYLMRPNVPFPAISVDLRSPILSSVDARANWWGSARGPHSCCNPDGDGIDLLILTDFRAWCLDEDCTELRSGALNKTVLSSIEACQLDPICSVGVRNSVIVYGASSAAALITFLAFITVTLYRRDLTSDEKIKQLLKIVLWAIISCDLLGVAHILAFFGNIPRNSLLWFVSRGVVILSLFTCVGLLFFQLFYAVRTLLTFRRARFAGLLGAFVGSTTIIPLSLYLMLAGQIQLFVAVRGFFEPIIGNEAQTFSIMVTYKAPPWTWAAWGLAMLPLYVLQIVSAVLTWRILRTRDFEEVETLKRDYQLLDSGGTANVLRRTTSASRARKLGFSLIITLIAALFLMGVGAGRFTVRQEQLRALGKSTTNIGATISAVLQERLVETFISDLLVPFFLIFVSAYGIYYIGFHYYELAASYLFVGMGYAHCVVLIVLATYYIFSTMNLDQYGFSNMFPSALNYVAAPSYVITIISLLAITILSHRFLRGTRAVLAAEITDVVYRRLEDVYGYDG